MPRTLVRTRAKSIISMRTISDVIDAWDCPRGMNGCMHACIWLDIWHRCALLHPISSPLFPHMSVYMTRPSLVLDIQSRKAQSQY